MFSVKLGTSFHNCDSCMSSDQAWKKANDHCNAAKYKYDLISHIVLTSSTHSNHYSDQYMYYNYNHLTASLPGQPG